MKMYQVTEQEKDVFYTTTDGTLLRKVIEAKCTKPSWYDTHIAFYGDVLVCCEVVAVQPHIHNISIGTVRYFDVRHLTGKGLMIGK